MQFGKINEAVSNSKYTFYFVEVVCVLNMAGKKSELMSNYAEPTLRKQ